MDGQGGGGERGKAVVHSHLHMASSDETSLMSSSAKASAKIQTKRRLCINELACYHYLGV